MKKLLIVSILGAAAFMPPAIVADAVDSATMPTNTVGSTTTPAGVVVTPPAGVVITTLFSDGSTNAWTQADLVAALQLVNRKYHRDVSTLEGRRAWHGKKLQESVDTNTLTKVTLYEDGTTFTDAAKVTTPAMAAASYNAALPRPVMTNGIPARLASARLRQREESQTTNVVTVTIGN